MSDKNTKNDRRTNAAIQLASGKTNRETAEICGISEKTVYRWSKEPTFQTLLHDFRYELMNAAAGKLVSEAADSIAIIRNIAHSGSTERIRLQAAVTILNQAQTHYVARTFDKEIRNRIQDINERLLALGLVDDPLNRPPRR